MLGEKRQSQEKPCSPSERIARQNLASKPQPRGNTQINRNGLNKDIRSRQ